MFRQSPGGGGGALPGVFNNFVHHPYLALLAQAPHGEGPAQLHVIRHGFALTHAELGAVAPREQPDDTTQQRV